MSDSMARIRAEADEADKAERARIRTESLFESAAEDVPRILQRIENLQITVDKFSGLLAAGLVFSLLLLALILWRLW